MNNSYSTCADDALRTAIKQEAEMRDGLLAGGRVVVIAVSDLVMVAVEQAEVERRDPCARENKKLTNLR